MVRFISTFLVLITLQSCGNQEADLKSTFNSIKNYENTELVSDLLDEQSLKFFKDVAEVASQMDESKIRSLSFGMDYPMSTRYFLQTIEFLFSENETEKTELGDIITIASLAEYGPLGLQNRKKYKFHELEEAGSAKATAIVNYEVAPNTYVQSKVLFYKENDQWKLNYPSTLSYFEKYLYKLQQQTGGSDREVIQSVIQDGGQEVKMMYRK